VQINQIKLALFLSFDRIYLKVKQTNEDKQMNKQAKVIEALKRQWMKEAAQGKAAAHMSFQEWYKARTEKLVNSWMVA